MNRLENLVGEDSDVVVVELQSLQVWQTTEGDGGQGEDFVVGQVQVFQSSQTLKGVVFNLKKEQSQFKSVWCTL